MSVRSIIRQLCFSCRQSVHLGRLSAVEAVAESIVRAGSVAPSRMGRSLRSSAKPKHNIKRVDRLLGNNHLPGEWHKFYASISNYVLQRNARPIVILDWSGVGNNNYTLTAAAPVGGRAIPIYSEVHPQSKYQNRQVHIQFLKTLQRILGPKRTPIVVADAGYRTPFMHAVKALGWDFVIRIRGGVCMRQSPSDPWLKSQDLYKQARREPMCLGVRRVSRERTTYVTEPIEVRLVLAKKAKRKGPKRRMRNPISGANSGGASLLAAARQPWLLATTLESPPQKVVALYALRMQIEETFRDVKNHRFGWSLRHVGSRCAKRMTTLLMLATIAMTAVTMLGIAAEARHDHRQFQANTMARRVLSYFFLGTCIVERGFCDITASQVLKLARNHFRNYGVQVV